MTDLTATNCGISEVSQYLQAHTHAAPLLVFVANEEEGLAAIHDGASDYAITGNTQRLKSVVHNALIREQLVRDRDEAVAAQVRAEEMNRLKSSFLANMSHEIRTPMTSILGFSNVLKEEVQDEQLKSYAGMIISSGNRLLQTLNSLLELAAMEAGKLSMALVPMRMASFVAGVAEEMRTKAEQKHLHYAIELPDDLQFFVNLDHKYFRDALRHVIENAIKFTSIGKITVALEKDSNLGMALLRVEDTGVGVSREFLEKAFDAFSQESSGLNRKFEGNGLGLTLAKHIVELLGGEIWLESTPGIGTICTMTFPLVAATPNGHKTMAEHHQTAGT